MRATVPPRRDFPQLEHRRKQAARLFRAGKLIHAAIARELKVSRQSVSRGYTEWQRGGAPAVRGAGRAGRKPKLSVAVEKGAIMAAKVVPAFGPFS